MCRRSSISCERTKPMSLLQPPPCRTLPSAPKLFCHPGVWTFPINSRQVGAGILRGTKYMGRETDSWDAGSEGFSQQNPKSTT